MGKSWLKKEALKDESSIVRLACYRSLGWDNCKEEAVNDYDKDIRLIAHRETGFYTEKSKSNYYEKIAFESYEKLGFDESAKENSNHKVRLEYYKINDKDSDAIHDKSHIIKRLYFYKNGWEDFDFNQDMYDISGTLLAKEAAIKFNKIEFLSQRLKTAYESATLLKEEKDILESLSSPKVKNKSFKI